MACIVSAAWSVSFRHGIIVNDSPPLDSHCSLASRLISSNVSRQST